MVVYVQPTGRLGAKVALLARQSPGHDLWSVDADRFEQVREGCGCNVGMAPASHLKFRSLNERLGSSCP